MTRLDEKDMSPGDLPKGRILPGDARHSEFHGIAITPAPGLVGIEREIIA